MDLPADLLARLYAAARVAAARADAEAMYEALPQLAKSLVWSADVTAGRLGQAQALAELLPFSEE